MDVLNRLPSEDHQYLKSFPNCDRLYAYRSRDDPDYTCYPARKVGQFVVSAFYVNDRPPYFIRVMSGIFREKIVPNEEYHKRLKMLVETVNSLFDGSQLPRAISFGHSKRGDVVYVKVKYLAETNILRVKSRDGKVVSVSIRVWNLVP